MDLGLRWPPPAARRPPPAARRPPSTARRPSLDLGSVTAAPTVVGLGTRCVAIASRMYFKSTLSTPYRWLLFGRGTAGGGVYGTPPPLPPGPDSQLEVKHAV